MKVIKWGERRDSTLRTHTQRGDLVRADRVERCDTLMADPTRQGGGARYCVLRTATRPEYTGVELE